MPLIQLVSPKGGVGRTTLCANLAVVMKTLGYRVVLVDLSPQNALCLHFQFAVADERGLVERFESVGDWQQLLIALEQGVEILPFGAAAPVKLQRFAEAQFRHGWLERHLTELAASPNTLVLVDTPVGHAATLWPAGDDFDLTLAVLMGDPGSLALLPRLAAVPPTVGDKEGVRHGYVLNQIDTRSRLKREIAELMFNRLSPRVFGAVHYDEAVAEALAEQRSVIGHAPFSAATRDFEELARTLAKRFPLRFTGSEVFGAPGAHNGRQ